MWPQYLPPPGIRWCHRVYVQGDHGGQRLGFVNYILVVPLCQVLLGQLKMGQNAEVAEQWGNIVELQK